MKPRCKRSVCVYVPCFMSGTRSLSKRLNGIAIKEMEPSMESVEPRTPGDSSEAQSLQEKCASLPGREDDSDFRLRALLAEREQLCLDADWKSAEALNSLVQDTMDAIRTPGPDAPKFGSSRRLVLLASEN